MEMQLVRLSRQRGGGRVATQKKQNVQSSCYGTEYGEGWGLKGWWV